jgi:catechol 2,3-dioxygenase-like lactoylglutathione lyase family enzyme
MKRLLAVGILFFSITSFSQVQGVGPIGITVNNMSTFVKFYAEVLGFKKISDEEFTGSDYEKLEGVFGLHIRVVRMQLGEEQIELTDYLTSGGRSIAEDAKANDLSFQHIAIVVSDMEKAYAQLRKFNVEFVSTAPQTLPKTIPPAEGVKAFYFHDPDKHNFELIYFPQGKGQAKWHVKTDKIFLGIDHTAIGISNTEKSLQFYQTLLGIERKGESFNFGVEQEHLNNVEGARLHITGLRSPQGPGIEFLQYLKPGIGKLYPADTRSNDLWYWQTTLYVSDIDAVYNKLQNGGYAFVSQHPATLQTKTGKSVRAFVVRDPDGHAMLIEENDAIDVANK